MDPTQPEIEFPPPEFSVESPFIYRPTDLELLAKLERKYTEYTLRIADEYTHPQQGVVMGFLAGEMRPLDAYIKQKLLRKVLDEGSVNVWQFQEDLEDDELLADLVVTAYPIILQRAATACGVINAYCRNTPELTQGGTGLK